MTERKPEDWFPSPVVGSELAVNFSHWRSFVTALLSSVEAGLREKDWIATHNAFALYSYSLIHFCSGHRVVSDPHHDLDLFDDSLGLAIIIDKVIHKSKGARLAFLPTIACQQIRNYVSHLQALAAHLLPNHSQLAAEIFAVSTLTGPRPMPLFFFLDDALNPIRILPKVLKAHIGARWGLPLNANRHGMPSFFFEDNCPAELVEAQMGHVESGCQPFGSYSTFAPMTVAIDLQPRLARYMYLLGWQVIKGLDIYHKGAYDTLRRAIVDLPSRSNFGPAVREENRNENWLADATDIDKIIKETLGTGERTAISTTEVSTMIANLIGPDMLPIRYLVRYELLRRKLASLRRFHHITVVLPGRLVRAQVDDSPIDALTLKQSRQADHWQQCFLDILSTRAKACTPPVLERRVAEIMVSAILNGALLFPMALEALPNALLHCANQLKDHYWIDIVLDPSKHRSPQRRWFPDPLSTALLIGLYANRPDTGWPALVSSGLFDEIQVILDALGITGQNTPKRKRPSRGKEERSFTSVLKQLIESATNYWRLRLPGVLLNYATGNHLGAALPTSHMFRLLTGRRVRVGKEKARPVGPHIDDSIAAAMAVRPTTPSLIDARQFWEALSTITRITRDEKGVGRRHAVKKQIDTDTTKLLHKFEGRLPVIALCLAGWVLQLCRHGTPFKEDVAHKTIDTYVNLIGEPLIELSYRDDFLSLDECSYTHIYSQVMNASKLEDKTYLASRLRQFHAFIIDISGVEDADWTDIYPEDAPILAGVDAGIITYKEYRRTLTLVIDDERRRGPDTPKDEQLRDTVALTAALFLLLGYHFGLRPGEIDRLRRMDIQRGHGFLIIRALSTQEGDLKSENGMRQIPLLQPLDTLEEKVLSTWLAYLEATETDKHNPLLRPDTPDFQGMSANTASILATKALRLATGDETVRLRHLRHSFASRLSLGLLADEHASFASNVLELLGGVSGQDIRQFLLGRAENSRRAFYALSAALGHHSPRVGLGNYIHLLDIVLSDYVTQQKAEIPDEIFAYALQLKYSHVRGLRADDTGIELGGTFIPCSKKHRLRLPTLHVELDDSEPSPITSDDVMQRTLSPLDCDRLLYAVARRRGALDGLAESFLVDDRIVYAVARTADTLQRRSGYVEFGLPDDDMWGTDTEWPSSEFQRETPRTRRYLESLRRQHIISNALDTDKVKQLADTWAQAYHPQDHALLFSDPKVLRHFLTCVASVGLSPSDFTIDFPADAPLPSAMRGQFENIASDLSMTVRDVTRAPQKITKDTRGKLYRVGLSLISGRSEVSYHRTLQRVIFVAGAWHAGLLKPPSTVQH